ncbi:MAG: FdhF/YdeP family oxidoreductase [Phycisphaerales bacterium]|nr:FdhF/YdeP family oxidoreductase [Phycisphaerales bacterium]
MNKVTTGGGWPAIRYAWRLARRVGGLRKLYQALRTRNACKTCALGMGGQLGGMTDESGRFPEVCKKSMQAMAADMQGQIEPRFFDRFTFDELRALSPRELEHMGRLACPVYAGPQDDRYRAIGWDDAVERCAANLKRSSPDENFFYFSGRSSNEAGFLLQLFARVYGTNNVNNCSYYCHQASGVGLSSAFGSGTATIELEDLRHCDLLFLIGGNPASNHPRLMRQLVELRRRGGQVIVINPLIETGLINFSVPSDWRSLLFGSKITDLYIQPHAGGDVALLVGIAKRIDEIGAVHDGFVSTCAEGFHAVIEHARRTSWEHIERDSGVDFDTIDRAARMYARSQASVFAWTMGITHHLHGVDNVRAIANLAMLRGMVGRPHAGLLPIRGHSNVQGIGSVGVTPKLKDAVLARLESHFGVKAPLKPGMDTLACLEAVQRGDLKHAWCLGGNLFGSNPDSQWTTAAFRRLDSVVYLNTTLNTGHAWGRAKETLILPVKARDEESQPTTQESMFNYVRLSEGGPARLDGPRGEVEVIAAVARAVLGDDGPVDWASMLEHRTIRQAIGRIIPGYEDIARIDETGREFQVAGRTFHAPKFATSSGKAKFHVTPLPDPALDDGELRLITLRSEGQFNTVVYDEDDLYRGMERRDVILMNEADIAARGLRADQIVAVRSGVGVMRVRVRPFAIRAGNAAMYYPEANVLVPRAADPLSRTPAFKSVPIRVAPVSAGFAADDDGEAALHADAPGTLNVELVPLRLPARGVAPVAST